jgi:circadian clock protein KaiB
MDEFRLYVAGNSRRGQAAIQSVSTVLESVRAGQYCLQIIDVFLHPEAADADKIIATPTLIRVSPEPTRRLMGDISNSPLIKTLLENG